MVSKNQHITATFDFVFENNMFASKYLDIKLVQIEHFFIAG